MMHKPATYHYFLFFILTSYLTLNCLSYAAVVNNKTASDSSSKHDSSNKNSPSPKKTAYPDHIYSTLDFIEPIDFIKPKPPRSAPLKSRTVANTYSNGAPNNILYKLGKEFLATNEGNNFVQDSFLVFSNTRQFLKETDLMLHNLTESISLYLGLDTLTQNSQPALQQSISSQLNDNQFSASTYQQQGENYQLHNNTKKQSRIYEESSSDNLIEKILNFQNLLYLIGIIIFFVIVKTIFSFMLLPPK
jgi:hypothetical protein